MIKTWDALSDDARRAYIAQQTALSVGRMRETAIRALCGFAGPMGEVARLELQRREGLS